MDIWHDVLVDVNPHHHWGLFPPRLLNQHMPIPVLMNPSKESLFCLFYALESHPHQEGSQFHHLEVVGAASYVVGRVSYEEVVGAAA